MADQLSTLVKNQKVFMVDAHGHENNPIERERMYDDPAYDLHLHKKTNPITINDRREVKVDIRIPLNNPDREAVVEIGGREEDGLPGQIKKEVKKALKDKKVRERFAHELADIMKTYPSQKLEDKAKVEEALRRFCEEFGLNEIPIKAEWFTHISQDQNDVSMLSLVSDKGERFNFLTCDNFMMAEQAEPTKKTIIRLYGAAQRGKTTTIKRVYRRLIEAHPDQAIIISNGEGKSDVKAILFINGAKVGIESQGDPNSRQMRSVDEFVSMGCDVILVAGRTRGMTKESIYQYSKWYNIEERYKPYIENEMDRTFNNRDVAMELAIMVEDATMRAYEEL